MMGSQLCNCCLIEVGSAPALSAPQRIDCRSAHDRRMSTSDAKSTRLPAALFGRKKLPVDPFDADYTEA